MKDGEQPICAEACPLRALEFGEINELREKYGSVVAIAPLPDPGYTGPNVSIVKPPNALDPGSEDGRVLNLKEVI